MPGASESFAGAATAATRPRLDPFAFPSDTDLRFVLLVAAVVGVSLFMYYTMSFYLTSTFSQAAQECVQVMNSTPGESAEQVAALTSCLAPSDRLTALWPTAGAILVLVVAWGLYWVAPVWKIRRDRLEPLTEEDAPEIVATVAALAREAGLAHPPAILTNADMTPSGLAFGRRGRYYLVLNAGLVMQSMLDPTAFEAVVRHELAHLRNGDVDKTYFSLAAGVSVLVAAFLPYVIVVGASAVRRGDSSVLLGLGWRILPALLLIYAPIAGILRARELYADVRASQWEGPGGDVANGGIRHVLAELEPVTPGRWRALNMHPSPALRARSVDDPRLLLGMSFWDALAVGAAATVAYPDLLLMLDLLTSGHVVLANLSTVLSGLLFGALAAAVVGTGVWRATFARLDWDRPPAATEDTPLPDPSPQGGRAPLGSPPPQRARAPLGLNRLAVGLGLGMLLGLALSSTAGLRDSSLLDGSTLLITLVWGAALIVSLRVLLSWVSVGARAWLAAAATHTSPRVAYLGGMVLTALVLGGWIGVLLAVRDFVGGMFGGSSGFDLLPVIGPPLALGGALMALPHPFAFAALVALWAFPLGAALWRRRRAVPSGTRWYWLDASDEPLLERDRGETRVGRAVVLGVVGGLAFCLLFAAVRAYLRVTLGPAVFETDETYEPLLMGEVAAAVLAQLIIGAVGAWRANRLAVAHGLCALTVAGLLMVGGMLALHRLIGPPVNPGIVPIGLGIVLNAAALVVAPVISLTALSSRWARGLRPRPR